MSLPSLDVETATGVQGWIITAVLDVEDFKEVASIGYGETEVRYSSCTRQGGIDAVDEAGEVHVVEREGKWRDREAGLCFGGEGSRSQIFAACCSGQLGS